MRMNGLKMGLLAGMAAVGLEVAAVPVVSNVQMRQIAGTKTVEITYDLADPDNDVLNVVASVSTNGVALPVKTVSGAVGEVAPGTGKRIVWDAGKDWGGRYTEIAKARVSASRMNNWCVIDLSGGPEAAAYPVEFVAAAPKDGWTSDLYRTTKLVLREISPGTFTMGSPSGELGRATNETPHEVTISKPFYIGVFEVTQRQWELVMGTRPSYFNNSACYAVRPVERVSYDDIRGASAGAKWPASDAVEASSFMGRLRARTELLFDLPTEAMWEYACRAGTVSALNSGKNIRSAYSDANMSEVGRYFYNFPSGGTGCSSSSGLKEGTAAVGSYAPNAWGLYDMHGNVCEWCLDWSGGLGTAAATNPKGAASGSSRVLRGGSWNDYALKCRSASRSSYSPSVESSFIGFRLCCAIGL